MHTIHIDQVLCSEPCESTRDDVDISKSCRGNYCRSYAAAQVPTLIMCRLSKMDRDRISQLLNGTMSYSNRSGLAVRREPTSRPVASTKNDWLAQLFIPHLPMHDAMNIAGPNQFPLQARTLACSPTDYKRHRSSFEKCYCVPGACLRRD